MCMDINGCLHPSVHVPISMHVVVVWPYVCMCASFRAVLFVLLYCLTEPKKNRVACDWITFLLLVLAFVAAFFAWNHYTVV